jgi:hypothetical protein
METGPLENCRHAKAYDYICADIARRNPPAAGGGGAWGELESVKLNADYGMSFSRW